MKVFSWVSWMASSPEILGIILLLGGSVLGCGETSDGDGSGGGAGSAPTEEEVESLRAELKEAALSASSCDADAECAVVEAGSKPCGGTWEYLPYSTSAEGAEDVVTKAEELAEKERAYNVENEILSDCSFVVEPGVVCSAGSCKLK